MYLYTYTYTCTYTSTYTYTNFIAWGSATYERGTLVPETLELISKHGIRDVMTNPVTLHCSKGALAHPVNINARSATWHSSTCALEVFQESRFNLHELRLAHHLQRAPFSLRTWAPRLSGVCITRACGHERSYSSMSQSAVSA